MQNSPDHNESSVLEYNVNFPNVRGKINKVILDRSRTCTVVVPIQNGMISIDVRAIDSNGQLIKNNGKIVSLNNDRKIVGPHIQYEIGFKQSRSYIFSVSLDASDVLPEGYGFLLIPLSSKHAPLYRFGQIMLCPDMQKTEREHKVIFYSDYGSVPKERLVKIGDCIDLYPLTSQHYEFLNWEHNGKKIIENKYELTTEDEESDEIIFKAVWAEKQPCIKQNDTIGPENESPKKKRIALYVIYDKQGILDNFRVYYLTQLRPFVDNLIAVVSSSLTEESTDKLNNLVDEIYFRENSGLLAGAWFDGIAHIGWDNLKNYDELLMLNDSFFGPFYPLDDFFSKMEASPADFYGVMKNYEEKQYTQIAGRPMKHGWFKGSICYFYVIKEKLLHSEEFKEYWSTLPEIKEDWDTYFFAEIDFYDYVLDKGFIIDAYQSDKLKGYFFDNLSHNIEKLIVDDKIPFARIRPFCTDVKDQSMHYSYGDDPRKALQYVRDNTEYDDNLIWDYILRSKNLTDIFNQLQLEYVLPRYTVEKPYVPKKIAVILHVYYEDQVPTIMKYCLNFPKDTVFYFTSTTYETKWAMDEQFSKHHCNFMGQIRPNVGVAMSTLWITYADVILNGDYDYICYFHDKKSMYNQFLMHGEQFAKRCYESLFGTPEIVKNIINLFEDNPRLGIIGPPMVYHGDYFTAPHRGWPGNYENTVALARELKLNVDIRLEKVPVAPYGDMFWFRPDALKKAISRRFTYDDFNVPYYQDFTLLHAIEHIYAFAAQDSGYYYAEVIDSDAARSDLINYQYMIYSLASIMLKNGFYPYNFEAMQVQLNSCKNNAATSPITEPETKFRIFCKKRKNKIDHYPEPLKRLAYFVGKKLHIKKIVEKVDQGLSK